ncbi:MAG: MOSC domain-containing protein [Propionibacteriales bacterium]|nr:MOSC domain-containing protein [Propionibacteriales bacterium]
MSAAVAWISIAPVKGLRIQSRDEVRLTEHGVPGDRAFFLVDDRGSMISATQLGPLMGVVPDHDDRAGTLALRFPDGREVAGPIELGEPEVVRFSFSGREVRALPVLGDYSAALSELCGTRLRLVVRPHDWPAVDRGPAGVATLLSVASLERLRVEAGVSEPVDGRRFRMTFGIDGLEPHEEDGWIDREVRVGDAVLRIAGHVGRCAATTRNADTGVVDFKTLHHLNAYRGLQDTTEPLAFGVYARVVRPGAVRVGEPVEPPSYG